MLLINSTNVLRMGDENNENGLKNPEKALRVPPESVWVNDAVVSVTILDSAGVELAGVSWPQVLPYVTGTEGVYSETFAPFTELKEGETYTIKYNVVGADSLELEELKREKAQRKVTC